MSTRTYLCVTAERQFKTQRLMSALARGFEARQQQARVMVGAPPNDMNPFVVWGQAWLSMEIIPPALERERPFWYIDNGYIKSARGGLQGYYRLTYRSMSPILLDDTVEIYRRPQLATPLPWRRTGKHILIAMPGSSFGKAIGLDVPHWISTIKSRVQEVTDRPIVIRQKNSPVSLATHFRDCWALVTHSSNVAVDAVLAGIPVFVEPTSPAAPVGRCDLDFEHPILPDRGRWLRSLLAQQFTLDEMRKGIAQDWMKRIAYEAERSLTARKEVLL